MYPGIMRFRLLWLLGTTLTACLTACIGGKGETKDGGPQGDARRDFREAGESTVVDGASTLPEAASNTPIDAANTGDGASVTVGGLCLLPNGGNEGDAGSSDAGSSESSTDAEASSSEASDAICPCTRRPGAANSFQCPMGEGEAATLVVGSSGGTLQLRGRQYVRSGVPASLAFPPAAISTPMAIVLTETSIPPPSDLLDWSPVYEVDPLGLVLAHPTPVTFPWSNSSGSFSAGIATGNQAPTLSIWFSADGKCFTRLDDSYTNAGFEQGSTTKLGYFLVGVPRDQSSAGCP